MTFNDIFGNHQYQFTQYIYELAAIIQNDTQTLVMCNLLNKFCNYTNATVQIHNNGKQYHFFHSQKSIYSNELFITRKKYEKAITELIDKGLISTFSAKQPNNNLIEITYFYLKLDAICETYQQGYRIMHNKEVVQKEPKQSKVVNQPANRTNTQQQNLIDKLNRDFKCGYINETTYNNRKQAITNKN